MSIIVDNGAHITQIVERSTNKMGTLFNLCISYFLYKVCPSHFFVVNLHSNCLVLYRLVKTKSKNEKRRSY